MPSVRSVWQHPHRAWRRAENRWRCQRNRPLYMIRPLASHAKIRFVGSVANWQDVSGSVKSHDRRSVSAGSRTAVCRRSDCSLRPLVSPIFTQLSRSGRNDGGTASFCGSIYDLEMGATKRTRTRCAHPASTETDKWFLANRRDLCAGGGMLDLSI